VVSIIIGVFTFVNSSAIESGESGLLNPLYYWTFILFLITVVLALLLPLPAILKNPKLLKRTLFVIVGAIVAVGLVYILSKGTPEGEEIMKTLSPIQQDDYTSHSLVANMNIIAVEIALLLSVVVVLWSAIKGIVKK
jgi:DMSO reductase anchor subunit